MSILRQELAQLTSPSNRSRIHRPTIKYGYPGEVSVHISFALETSHI